MFAAGDFERSEKLRASSVGAAYIHNICVPQFTLDVAPTELAAGGMRWATKTFSKLLDVPSENCRLLPLKEALPVGRC